MSGAGDFRTLVRVRVTGADGKPEGAFGIGTYQLLLGIEAHGSLNRAAREMGMAYSKAWNSVNGTEKCLGFALISRNGARGSSLTPEGARFIRLYERMCQAAQEAAEKAMAEPFPAP